MTELISKESISRVLDGIEDTKIGVIGDFSLDAYWLLEQGKRELSIETGKPTHAVIKQKYSLGGAGNVINNLVGLRVGEVSAYGVISNDIFGREMLKQLQELGVNLDGMIIQEDAWDTPVYAKPYLGAEEQERIDFGRFNKIDTITEGRLLTVLSKAIRRLDALIINQQLRRGVYSPSVIAALNEIAAAEPSKIFVLDSRNMTELFRGMVCKLNASEAALMCGELKESNESIPVDEIRKYAVQIYKKILMPLYITRSGRGILLYDGQQFTQIPGIQILRKIDPVGAGDTTISAITATLAAKGNYELAGEVGNLAAAITVQKLQQTGVASPAEILETWQDANYIYRPELGDDVRRAKYLENSEIEITIPEFLEESVQHIIFDNDGTISVLRQGWETIMEPMMVRSILGDSYGRVDEEMYHRVVRRVTEYIDQSTGIETIHQMEALVEMVREFGFVPAKEVLDPQGYKELYNQALMQEVDRRLQKLQDGELDVPDFVIKGAIDFVRKLHAAGIKLYLASGTDHADVVREAKSLGYAEFFEDRIYGYMGDASTNTKRNVIKTIIGDNRLHREQFVCFGDGPVELRETKRFGGTAVGVASDEVRRYGLNFSKRNRLVKGGADLIIPDYSQSGKLLDVLLGRKRAL